MYFLAQDNDLAPALAGFAAVHRDRVRLSTDPTFVTARNPDANRAVGLVSGGGSGHEPLHLGFVGAGMLDAAVPGRLFASPHNRQIYEASKAVAGRGGVLHIVKNYTGDVINFNIAAERLRLDGLQVASVLVADDVATAGGQSDVGMRGTGATLVVEKMVGAAADAGAPLKELKALGDEVVSHSRSLAVASRAHTSVSSGSTAFMLDQGQLEYGVGIHGERGTATTAEQDLDSLVERMTNEIVGSLPPQQGDNLTCIAVVNGLGGVTELELYSVYDSLSRACAKRSVTLERSLVGSYITALDMRGFSITLTLVKEGWLNLWDRPVDTAAFPGRHDNFGKVSS